MANELDGRGTRWLARRAFDDRAISAIDWEFIDENPSRAGEVKEFVDWLSDQIRRADRERSE